MQKSILTLFGLALGLLTFGQTNISLTNPIAADILSGNYNSSTYQASTIIDRHEQILCELENLISTDSLKAYLEEMEPFYTRHTFSDTLSPITGIGAARKWALRKFQSFSQRNENRLVSSYLKFDYPGTSCGDFFGLKNILAILPGRDTVNHSTIIIQAHFDSRCEGRCDDTCYAPGMEDNGSGSALVLELARVMSRYTFDNTIVFMLTVGEEQGLLGASAMAEYCTDNNISVKAVQNNDIIGGIYCGKTSSPPSCPAEDHVDSLSVRLFSSPALSGSYRTFARTIKMFYEEKMKANVAVPMDLRIIAQEDRSGRGGDHIPFRREGIRNLRFTAANEHGDAGHGPGYTDRQHTTNDILGVDTDNDAIIDSFYVDFNYLARNTFINGMTTALLAQGPETPEFILHDEPTGLRVEITSNTNMPEYRVGVALFNATDFMEVYRFTGTSFLIPNQVQGTNYHISVAALDNNKMMSAFSAEKRAFSDSDTPPGTLDNLSYSINCNNFSIYESAVRPTEKIVLIPCLPNPNKGKVTFQVMVNEMPKHNRSYIKIVNGNGTVVDMVKVELKMG